MIDDIAVQNFQATVWDHYHAHGRHGLAWRQPDADGSFDPYKIMVSELMLQQTQVSRVIPKFQEFLALFPTLEDLARAEPGAVLRAWSGLGYNRRAKFLHQAAQLVSREYAGVFPATVSGLVKLPGVGKNTAGAIAAYAFNQAAPFIETNIRTVYIHRFFHDRSDVSDTDILTIAEAAMDREHPREWYWALMDYGAFLKQTVGNLNKLSNTYKKQSAFHGSRRQIRGQVIRLLGTKPLTYTALAAAISDPRLDDVLTDLLKEGLITKHGRRYVL